MLKEFGYCHKHYHNFTHFLVGPAGLEFAQNKLRRVNELIVLLEKEAAVAKQYNGDMFQRKTKIIPKFKVRCLSRQTYVLQDLRSVILKRIEELQQQQNYQLQHFHCGALPN